MKGRALLRAARFVTASIHHRHHGASHYETTSLSFLLTTDSPIHVGAHQISG
jgi:hypothetical protein